MRFIESWKNRLSPRSVVKRSLLEDRERSAELRERRSKFSPNLSAYKEQSEWHEAFYELEPITKDHPDTKLARLASEFEKMLEHPLVKKFKRNNIHLFLDNSDDQLRLARAIGQKLICVPTTSVNILTDDELAAFVGHELGHMLRLDGHPRRKIFPKMNPHESEYMADELGAIISGHPESITSALDKIREHVVGLVSRGNLPEEKKQGLIRLYSKDHESKTYPSHAKRIERMEQVAQKMQTEEGKKALIKDLEDRLKTEHRRLFSHHYNCDPSSYTR